MSLKRMAGFVLLAACALFAARSVAADQYSESLYSGLQYRNIGPFRGGRVLAVAGVPGTSTFYFGSVSGGVWKTTNSGMSWTPLTDKENISSVGSIAVANSNPNIIYVGTGEACIRGNISYGNGIWKSLDGGKTWAHIGLEDTRQIGKVVVDPQNPDVVFVAALGHAYGPNTERGVFRSHDGGKTWEKVLYKDDRTGAIDVAMDPGNSNVLFAALWQAYRTPWSLESGGPGSGLYRSNDGGTTWKQVTGNGIPRGILGRIGVSISGANSDRVYAAIEAKEGGVFRSDDGGEHWTKTSGDSRFTQRAWYYMHIFADPQAADTVYILNTGLYRSTDGGRSWNTLRAPHGDHHGLWIDPKDPKHLINSNDGGATISLDGGLSWSTEDNQPTAQFYHVATDNRFRYYVYGAQQDNSTVAIASSSDGGSIDRTDWYSVGGGESGFVVPYLPDPNIVYAGSYDGLITRYNKSNGQQQDINPWPDNPMGSGADVLKYRFQWTAPIATSPHDPNVLYHGANVLFRSTNGGMSWTAISPDLTRNDKSKQGPSGGPLTKDNTSVEYYDTIFALAESPVEKGLIWAGSDDGLIHVTRDDGAHWTNVTPKDIAEWSMISLIDASPHDAGTAYVAVDRHRLDDINPYIYKTSDYGKTWTKLTNGIPNGSFVHVVRQDTKDRNLLFAGTETGVFVSFDGGKNWQTLKLNLPVVPVHDMTIKNNDLVVATHGRSFWILDDIEPLRQLSAEIAKADVHFYNPAPAWRARGGRGFGRAAGAAGANPPGGAVLDYYLKEEAKGPVTLDILDSQGNTVRHFSSVEQRRRRRGEGQETPSEFEEFFGPAQQRLPAKAGMNRFSWDLRYEAPAALPGFALWGGRPTGPLAVPGNYQAKLTVNGKSYTVPFEVKLDPRVPTSVADLQKQFDLAMKIAKRVNEAHEAVNQMQDLRAQLTDLKDRFEKDPNAKVVLTSADDLVKKLSPIEDEIVQTKSKASEDPLNYPIRINNKLVDLQGTIESADTAPTEQSYQVFDMLSAQLDDALAKWKDVSNKDVAAINDEIRKGNMPVIYISAGN